MRIYDLSKADMWTKGTITAVDGTTLIESSTDYRSDFLRAQGKILLKSDIAPESYNIKVLQYRENYSFTGISAANISTTGSLELDVETKFVRLLLIRPQMFPPLTLGAETDGGHEKVFAICEDKCLEETMTKEQIMYRLPRITIATKSGEDPNGGTFRVYDNDIVISPVPKIPMIIALMTDGWIQDEMINVTDISNLKIGIDSERKFMEFDLKTEAIRISVVYIIFP